MDGARFDALTRGLGSGPTRRHLLKGSLAMVAGGALSLFGRGQVGTVGAVCGPTASSLNCSPGQDCCNGYCVNTSYDNAHCGSCYNACSLTYGQTCSMGICSGGSGSSGGGSADSDGDAISDYDEAYVLGTSPYSIDSDGDYLTDYWEVYTTGTSPLYPDTDGDGYLDGVEYQNGWNPLDPYA